MASVPPTTPLVPNAAALVLAACAAAPEPTTWLLPYWLVQVGRGSHNGLVGVGPHLNCWVPKVPSSSGTAEFGGLRDAVELRDELRDFLLQRLAVARAVGGITTALPVHAPAAGCRPSIQCAFCCLASEIPSPHCTTWFKPRIWLGETLGDGQARGIVLSAVDAQPGGQALDRGVERGLACAQIALCRERCNVGIDGSCHDDLQ